ncbi:hypothetical protein EHW99_2140 [Erwinia amylovora]|uniref:Uncharacterized protein n=3 Tax=Erwinia amylovora TaxID=552 RepID=A0A831EQA2_ERWAM|nr:hypothetical protein EaACW_1447 [Erwinia amylovora ACW56400]QJQ54842.1 hypothetical protein EHX00_2140 [Erwinia amylovora]CBA20391.1 hypothetical protein predicted by Glimmer/Critica [Erwinia amylovora CFBP1430]CBX80301.1 hypothetical protein predicted by Glimmer/Critica [Erwinia amylovora ATCC BAA-2158]CCO78295.1 hypothetical protein BN432_1491 [Erwinia amylovora Ea356]CCO82084.1 hypothetical protein BN433_1506 [Erwinia amylovora Ea266]CCO85880.1 hypothetical protein BN434_1486 [Erwinia a
MIASLLMFYLRQMQPINAAPDVKPCALIELLL